MKNNNKNKIYASLAMLLLLGISFVSAFSVAYPYMGESKQLIIPLDSKVTDLQFVLQNGGATEDTDVQVNILSGSEVLSLVEESNIYAIHPGQKVPVNLRITLPENATVGDSYNIKLEFITVAKGGGFAFGTAQEQSFKVVAEKIVVGKETPPVVVPKKFNLTHLLLIIIGILLVTFIVILMIKRRNEIPIKRK